MKPRRSEYVLPILLAVAGLAAWALTSLMNYQLHLMSTHTEAGRLLQGGASLLVDCMVVVFGLTLGTFLARGRRGYAALAGLVLAAFAGYSMLSVISFGVSERIGKAQIAERSQAETAKALKKANDFALEQRTQTLNWLKSTIAQTPTKDRRGRAIEGNGEQRMSLVSAVVELAEKPVEVKLPPSAEPVVGDVEASVMASLLAGFGATEFGFQLGKAVVLGVLLVLAKMFAFPLVSYLWPRREAVSVATAVEAPAALPAPAANDTAAPAAPAETKPAMPDLPVPVRVVDEAPEEVGIVPADIVREFLGEARRGTPASSVARAGVVYEWFRAWCEARSYPTMTQAAFGRLCGELGVVRDQQGSYTRYFGLRSPAATGGLKIAA